MRSVSFASIERGASFGTFPFFFVDRPGASNYTYMVMPLSAAEIKEAVKTLNESEQAEILESLLDLLDPGDNLTPEEIQKAQLEEVQRRAAELDAGGKTLSEEEFNRELEKRRRA